MSNPKISIIIPVYNVEKYLNRCLDSIVNQTLEDIEVICVNDGSRDNSLQILKKYAEQDNRIKVIDKENEGQGYARKVGLDNATGEYILFCDSDDYYAELTVFEKLYKFTISKRVDVVVFDFYHISLNSNFKNRCYFFSNSLNKEVFTYKDVKNINIINTSPCIRLYAKSFLDSYNDWYFPKKIFYEDTPFHFQVLFRANFYYLREPFYVYALRDNSTTTIFKTDKNFLDIYITTKVAFDFVNSLDIENKNEILNQLLLYFLNKLNARFDRAFLNVTNAEYIISSIKLFDISSYEIDRLVYKEMSRRLFFIFKAIKRFTPEQFRDYINKKQFREQYRQIQKLNIQNRNFISNQKNSEIQNLHNQNNDLRNQNNIKDQVIKRLQNSWSYRIGRLITYPLSIPLEFYKYICDYNLIKKSNLFDSEYYLANNEDVKNAKVDPIKHYLKFGWKEGRNPSTEFDGNEYLNKRPDVKVAGICPLVHYLRFGKDGK